MSARRDELLALATKLEAATEGNEELDLAINGALKGRPVGDRQTYTPYSRSLDAALSLVPEGMLWKQSYLLNLGSAEAGYATPPGEPERVYEAGIGVPQGSRKLSVWVEARSFATPAVALCAAALRARAANARNEGDGPWVR